MTTLNLSSGTAGSPIRRYRRSLSVLQLHSLQQCAFVHGVASSESALQCQMTRLRKVAIARAGEVMSLLDGVIGAIAMSTVATTERVQLRRSQRSMTSCDRHAAALVAGNC